MFLVQHVLFYTFVNCFKKKMTAYKEKNNAPLA